MCRSHNFHFRTYSESLLSDGVLAVGRGETPLLSGFRIGTYLIRTS